MIRKPRSLKRVIPAFGLALLASLALSVVAAGSASAATQYWYSCQNTVEGPYTDPFCGTKGLGTYSSVKLAAGVPKNIIANSTTNFALKWKTSGVNFEVKCTTLQSGKEFTNTIENPAGKVPPPGIASTTFLLTGCAPNQPKNCTIQSPWQITVSGVATEFEGKPAVKFSPPSGAEQPITAVKFEGPTCSLKTTFYFYGSFTGIMNKATSSLEFTEASSGLTYGFGGNKATFVGTSKIETSGGEALSLAP